MALLTLAVAACSGGDDQRGKIGYVEGFLGGVVADEPRAALIGRDVLSAGGSVADAAVAVAFALSVTLPSSGGLGGGGACVTYHVGTNEVWSLDFSSSPAAAESSRGRPVAVPGVPRGMFALHSKYGRLRWGQLISPAENIARFGDPVSRALARDLAASKGKVGRSASMRGVFTQKGSRELIGERDLLVQLDLAGTLGQLRSKGPGDLYSGRLGRQIVDSMTRAGGALEMAQLSAFTPQWREPLMVEVGNEEVIFPSAPVFGGNVAAQMFAFFEDDDRFEDASEPDRAHLVAETGARLWPAGRAPAGGKIKKGVRPVDLTAANSAMRGYRVDRHTAAPAGGPAIPAAAASTGFVVADQAGSAVACTLSMNKPFGAGLIAEGTGLILAEVPTAVSSAALAPALMINRNVNEFFAAVAPSGGAGGVSSMVSVLSRMTLAEQPAMDALQAPRAHNGGAPDTTYAEQDGGLSARGHRVDSVRALGRVNVISCPDGIPPEPETCESLADPRGAGLAATAD